MDRVLSKRERPIIEYFSILEEIENLFICMQKVAFIGIDYRLIMSWRKRRI